MGIKSKASAAKRVLKTDGVLGLTIKTLQKAQKKTLKQAPSSKISSVFLVDRNDVLKANWSETTPPSFGKNLKSSYTINWVMSPPGKGSGGHQNLFRFIKYLEEAGHKCRVYLYSTIDNRSIAEVREVLADSYPKTKTSLEWLGEDMKPADAIFATGWETAYPVFNSKLSAKRFYFVQDFEPFFYPMGSEYVLAENTYRFGFYGTTAGGWLAEKLRRDYGMSTDYFDFAADKKLYKFTNTNKRKEIFFYARPVTARRGFELGIMALELFHKKHPEYTINLAGWDVSEYDIPFPHNSLSTMRLSELSKVYNRCAVGLVMSLTNLSLLPLELIACGVIPVVNDGENNRLVSNNPFIAYTPNHPAALANQMSDIVLRKDLQHYSAKAAASIVDSGWDNSGKKFVAIVEREIANG